MAKRVAGGNREAGFAFLEYLMATMILTVALLSLLQTMALTLGNYTVMDQRRREVVQRWNRTEEARSREPQGVRVVLVPDGPSLWRLNVSGAEDENAPTWEVLRSLP